MDADPLPKNQILQALEEKATTKAIVFDRTLEEFNTLKEVLSEMSNDLNELLEEMELKVDERRLRFEYRDRGKFEAELKFADDVLVFSMHTDIFQFDRDSAVWKYPYTKDEKLNSYCGIINVYNFLSDSMKYSRSEDLGYMVARLFINREGSFFIEGKRQKRNRISNFGKYTISREELCAFVESAVKYTLSFDLLVPPFDLVKVASVEQINAKIESSKMRTGKRMGYKYNSDDVIENE